MREREKEAEQGWGSKMCSFWYPNWW